MAIPFLANLQVWERIKSKGKFYNILSKSVGSMVMVKQIIMGYELIFHMNIERLEAEVYLGWKHKPSF